MPAPVLVFPDLAPFAERIVTEAFLADVDGFLVSLTPPAAVPSPLVYPHPQRPAEYETTGGGGSDPAPVVRDTGSTPAVSGGGGIDFEGLNQCEASGENGWRTGRYGIEAGYPIGHLSDAEQQAWVQRIYSQYGAGAWGVACQRYLGG
jgi:hypothetical protein